MDISLIQGPEPIYRLHGKLSFADNEAMRPVLEDMGDGSGRTVILDLSELDYVDSFGIGLFLVALDEVRKAGNHLLIRNPQGAVKRIFALANLDTLLEIEGSLPPPPPSAPSLRGTMTPPHAGLRVWQLQSAADDSASVALSGRFTFNDHDEFDKVLAIIASCGAPVLTLDLQGLEFMDSAGLSMVLVARDEADRRNIRLRLASPCGRVAQLLHLAAIDTLVDIRDPR